MRSRQSLSSHERPHRDAIYREGLRMQAAIGCLRVRSPGMNYGSRGWKTRR